MERRLRVILHPGFHKTGTTTLQQTLRANRRRLKDYLRIVLRPGMVGLCEAARAWSVAREPLDMALLRLELARMAEGWDTGDPRPVLLACEDLSGHMPGRHGLTAYTAAAPLIAAMAQVIETVRPGAEMTVFLSTRGADDWLASSHAQHLAATRMTLDARSYAARFRGSADLDAVADAVAGAQPHPVHRVRLEDCRNRRLGPLDPLLDLIGLPDPLRASLVAQPPANRAPPQPVLNRLLALNRSDLDDAALRSAKATLLHGAV